jgi:hypothetical protein
MARSAVDRSAAVAFDRLGHQDQHLAPGTDPQGTSAECGTAALTCKLCTHSLGRALRCRQITRSPVLRATAAEARAPKCLRDRHFVGGKHLIALSGEERIVFDADVHHVAEEPRHLQRKASLEDDAA